MTQAERDFIARLTALAAMCGFTLTPELIALYDRNLCASGYPKLVMALDYVIVNRKSRDPFPSIKEIRDLVAPESDPEVEAIEAAGRIVQAVTRVGPYQTEKAREFIGELGWLVVQREGGWQTVCQILTDDNIGILKAQWRQMAKAQYARAKAGVVTAPALPQPEEKGRVIPFDMTKLLPEMPR